MSNFNDSGFRLRRKGWHQRVLGRRRRGGSRPRRPFFQPGFLHLEDRWLMATLVVTNTLDSGLGSLRGEIAQSNATGPGPNTIDFDIPTSDPGYDSSGGVWTISLLSALPSISVPVTIDGTSQTGYSTTPVIDLDGTSAGAGADGLSLAAGSAGSQILGLMIENFANAGIDVASANNTIGGPAAGDGNLISGNTGDGVEITGSGTTGNLVAGNFIGTDWTGTVAIGNGTGVEVDSSATGNTIGGVTSTPGTGAGNLISGNADNGVVIDGTGQPAETRLYLKADGNTNNSTSIPPAGYVGGATLVGGVTYGTGVTGQAFQFNDTAGERVVVDDVNNGLAATALTLSAWINLSSLPGTTPFVIASRVYSATSENYGLYVNSAGELVFEWYSAGAFQTEASSGADLGTRLGVFQQVAVVTDGSTIMFYVNGVAVSSAAMPDPLDDTASGILEIGGLSEGPNLFDGLIDEISVTLDPLPSDEIARIYANAGQGTDLGGSGTQDTTVIGNLIGTNSDGTIAISNGGDGIEINDAFNNTIGGSADGPSNVISGNTGDGVEITGTGATGNVVAGDYIGTDMNGTVAIADGTGVEIDTSASGNTIGGLTSTPGLGLGNVVSGNTNDLLLYGSADVVAGNLIGLNAAGTAPLNPATQYCIQVYGTDNMIGGLSPNDRNVITGAYLVIYIAGSGAQVLNNYIGTDITGTIGLEQIGQSGNVGYTDIWVYGAGPGTVIGAPGAGNVIGDCYVGEADIVVGDTPGVFIQGNKIGTNAAGTAALVDTDNGNGILIDDSDGFQIGGTAAGAGNLISGNFYYAIMILESTGGVIQGNDIGTDVTGMLAVPNDLNPSSPAAVILNSGVSDVTIGGTTAAAGNVISGNDQDGIFIGSRDRNNGVYGNPIAAGVDQDNTVEGNVIGLKADGSGALSNLSDGIDVTTSAVGTVIGGTAPGEANVISGNAASGVLIDGTGLPGITPLYLKADGNTNNATYSPEQPVGGGTLVGGVTYGTGVTGEAFQFADTPGERVVVSDPNNSLAAYCCYALGLDQPGQPSRGDTLCHRFAGVFGHIGKLRPLCELERRACLRVVFRWRVPHRDLQWRGPRLAPRRIPAGRRGHRRRDCHVLRQRRRRQLVRDARPARRLGLRQPRNRRPFPGPQLVQRPDRRDLGHDRRSPGRRDRPDLRQCRPGHRPGRQRHRRHDRRQQLHRHEPLRHERHPERWRRR